MVRPADYPPPLTREDTIAEPTDPPGERIEVGALIVGAGPAGLACAIRLGQLVEESPPLAERLGEVPIAVLDKGTKPGAHLLSGAVVNPISLRSLFAGRRSTEDMPFFGRVEKESVYFLTRGRAWRIPAPPTMRNHGNYVASLSQVGRWLAEEAEALGVTVLPETSADKLLVSHGRVVGVRTGDRGRGRDGEPLARFEPGSDIGAQVTVLAEGTQGYLTGAAIDRFGLHGRNPQVWALGVKEVWRVPKPLRKVIHTMGWPLRGGKRYREFGGSFIYPMGDDLVSLGMVVGLDYRDVSLSVHDLLQELKTHKLVRRILAGGERIAWGAKTIPEGGFYSLPSKLHGPGVVFCGDGAGFVNVPALKGIHYAVESGVLAAEAIAGALRPGEAIGRSGALSGYDDAVRQSFVYEGPEAGSQHAAGIRQGLLDGAPRGRPDDGDGRHMCRERRSPPSATADQELIRTDRAASYPDPDGKLTFDKLSSVFLSGNQTRDDAPSHIRVARRVPREVGELWVNMCPAHVYELGREDAGKVEVAVTPSNCVQCGAITAKGGRLLPAEGGAGPEYTLT